MVGYGDDVIKPSAIAAAGVVPLASGLDQTVTLLIVLVLGGAIAYRLIKHVQRAYRTRRSIAEPPPALSPADETASGDLHAHPDSTPTEVLPRIEMMENR